MGGVDKIMAPLCGRPLVTHSLDAFESSPLIARIVLVVPPAGVDAHRDLVGEHGYSRIEVVPGGERRQDSVRRGLDALGAVEWTIVHDGARPCIDGEVIETGLQAAKSTGAAAPAQPLSDTIKEVDGSGMVVRTLDRETGSGPRRRRRYSAPRSSGTPTSRYGRTSRTTPRWSR